MLHGTIHLVPAFVRQRLPFGLLRFSVRFAVGDDSVQLCRSFRPCAGDKSFKCLLYQLSMVGYMPTMVITGNGESGFDSGEGA